MAGIHVQMLTGTGRDGEVLRLPGRLFVVGRGNGCEVRVESDLSSREHATLSLESDSWVVRDRDSRNGTILNGRRITNAPLRPLDEIQLGTGGPTLRIVTMEPAPSTPERGEDPPRVPRIDRDETAESSAATDEEAIPVAVPLPEAPPRSPAAMAPPPKRSSKPRRMPPVFALLGLGFAVTVAMGIWGGEFPYEPATAPILWCMAAFRYVAPDALPDPGAQLFLFRGLLAGYGLLAGFLLQRPIRRIVFLVAVAGLHVLAALAL